MFLYISGDAVRARSIDALTAIYHYSCSLCGTRPEEGNKQRNIQIADIEVELLRSGRNRQLPGLHYKDYYGRKKLLMVLLGMRALVDQV